MTTRPRKPAPGTPAPGKLPLPEVAEMKRRGDRIVMITAYDAPSARIADKAGVDLILVGDPAGRRVVGGHHHDAVAAALHLPNLGERQLARGGRAGRGLAWAGGHERAPFERGMLSISRVEPTRTATTKVGPSRSATST